MARGPIWYSQAINAARSTAKTGNKAYGRVAPWFGVTTLLKRKKQTCGHPDTKNGADPVQVKILPPALAREVRVGGSGLSLEEKTDKGHRQGSDRQINVKAPTPRDLIGEGAT